MTNKRCYYIHVFASYFTLSILKKNKIFCFIFVLLVFHSLLNEPVVLLIPGYLCIYNVCYETCVAISVSPHVCFILVLILISMFLR